MTPTELAEELDANEQTLRRLDALIADLFQIIGTSAPTIHQVSAMAFYTGDLYEIVENSMKRVLRYFNRQMPTGEQWHRELLVMFADGAPPPIPVVATGVMRSKLDELRSFRHVMRVHYSFTLEWERVNALAKSGPQTVRQFLQALKTALQLP